MLVFGFKIISIFVPIVPAKPLHNAQIGRSSLFIGLVYRLLSKISSNEI